MIGYKHLKKQWKQQSNNIKYHKVVVKSNSSQGVINHVENY